MKQKRTKEDRWAAYWSVPDAYTVTTKKGRYEFSGNWREMLRELELYGYIVPISACRDLWHGRQRYVRFNGVEIEVLAFLFGKL